MAAVLSTSHLCAVDKVRQVVAFKDDPPSCRGEPRLGDLAQVSGLVRLDCSAPDSLLGFILVEPGLGAGCCRGALLCGRLFCDARNAQGERARTTPSAAMAGPGREAGDTTPGRNELQLRGSSAWSGGLPQARPLTVNQHSHCGQQPGHIQQRLLLVVQGVKSSAHEGVVIVFDSAGAFHRLPARDVAGGAPASAQTAPQLPASRRRTGSALAERPPAVAGPLGPSSGNAPRPAAAPGLAERGPLRTPRPTALEAVASREMRLLHFRLATVLVSIARTQPPKPKSLPSILAPSVARARTDNQQSPAARMRGAGSAARRRARFREMQVAGKQATKHSTKAASANRLLQGIASARATLRPGRAKPVPAPLPVGIAPRAARERLAAD